MNLYPSTVTTIMITAAAVMLAMIFVAAVSDNTAVDKVDQQRIFLECIRATGILAGVNKDIVESCERASSRMAREVTLSPVPAR